MNDTTLKNPALRYVRDWFRALGAEFEWNKGDRMSPVTLIVDYCRDHDDADSFAATDALVFAAPRCGNFRALTIWLDGPATTFQQVKDCVEAADVAVNGGADAS